MKLASTIYGSVTNENAQLPMSYGHACQKNICWKLDGNC